MYKGHVLGTQTCLPSIYILKRFGASQYVVVCKPLLSKILFGFKRKMPKSVLVIHRMCVVRVEYANMFLFHIIFADDRQLVLEMVNHPMRLSCNHQQPTKPMLEFLLLWCGQKLQSLPKLAPDANQSNPHMPKESLSRTADDVCVCERESEGTLQVTLSFLCFVGLLATASVQQGLGFVQLSFVSHQQGLAEMHDEALLAYSTMSLIPSNCLNINIVA